MNEVPVIDPKKCNGCGLCISVCQCGALILIDNIVTVIATTECDWCTECEAVCITGALSCPFEIVVEEA
jgi:MinD superfamily P-loop ATPase